MADRLYRSRDDRMLAGVAGGLARVMDADPSIIRVVWVAGDRPERRLGLLVYIVMADRGPRGPDGWDAAADSQRQRRGRDAPWTRPARGRLGPDGTVVPHAGTAPGTSWGAGMTASGAATSAGVPALAAATQPTTRTAGRRHPRAPRATADGRRDHRRDPHPRRWRVPRPRVHAGRRPLDGLAGALDRVRGRAAHALGPTGPDLGLTPSTAPDRPVRWGRGRRDHPVGSRWSPAAASSAACASLVRGMGGYRTASRIADTSTSTIELDRRRRGPPHRGHRAGRDGARVAPPERAVRLLPRDDRDDDGDDLPATPRSERSGSGSATRRQRPGLPARRRGSTRPSGSTRRPASLGDEPPGLVAADRASVQVGEPDRRGRHRRAAARPRPAEPAGSGGCAAAMRPSRRAPLPRGPPGAGRRHHDRRAGPAVRRPAPTRPARTSGPGADAVVAGDPEVGRRPRRGPRGGHARRRSGGRLGQCRDPGLRHRTADPRGRASTPRPIRSRSRDRRAAERRRADVRDRRPRRSSSPRRTRCRC